MQSRWATCGGNSCDWARCEHRFAISVAKGVLQEEDKGGERHIGQLRTMELRPVPSQCPGTASFKHAHSLFSSTMSLVAFPIGAIPSYLQRQSFCLPTLAMISSAAPTFKTWGARDPVFNYRYCPRGRASSLLVSRRVCELDGMVSEKPRVESMRDRAIWR